jgi:predicted nucleic acid-binding protein
VSSDTVVVDTSIVARGIFGEPGETEANRLLLSDVGLAAPDLLVAEFANVLTKKIDAGVLVDVEIQEVFGRLDSLAIDLVDMRPLAHDAVALALSSNHSLYDCLFVALARARACPLATADRRLAQIATEQAGITLWQG